MPARVRSEAPGGAMSEDVSRRSFLKAAGAGTAGAALFGASLGLTGHAAEYLPNGGSRMNVVLVVVDSLRPDHIGAYGNGWIQTPSLDALASDSLRFTRAYPESTPTITARRAIHTGFRSFPFRDYEYAGEFDVRLMGWQPIPGEQTTLAEILEEQGYSTMLVTDTLHMFRPTYNFHRGFGIFDFIRGQERDLYRPLSWAPAEGLGRCLLPGESAGRMKDIMEQYLANTRDRGGEEDWFSPRVFSRAMELLEAAGDQQPFFLCVDSYDAHEPWDPPQEYIDLYGEPYDGPEPYLPAYGPSGYLTGRELQRMRTLYAAEVTMVDRWLGRFMDRAEDLGLMDNTLFILLSDHGVGLGEHGFTGKVSSELYPELVDIPFLIRHPEGKGAGRKSDYFASTHDVSPTILGTLGIEPPQPMEGQDLSSLINGDAPEQERRHFTVGYDRHVLSRDDRYALISRDDGAEPRLFDLQNDPDHERDIAKDNPDIVRRMFEEYVIADADDGPQR